MRLAIEEVPRSLSEGYLRSLAKFSALTIDDQKLVQLLFEWCVFAARPMMTSELGVCLLAVDAETCSLHEDDIITETDTLSSLTDASNFDLWVKKCEGVNLAKAWLQPSQSRMVMCLIACQFKRAKLK